MPTREALERESIVRVPDAALQRRMDSAAQVWGVALLRASIAARLGLAATAICLLWIAVYWALR